MLINKRKFDIRVFALYTAHVDSKLLRGYIFNDGYLRTCCKEYDVSQVENRFIHLTNDAVQKTSVDYGKFESGNKLSYQDIDRILIKEKGVSFFTTIVPKIKEYVKDVFVGVGPRLYMPTLGKPDCAYRFYNGFEVMGFDFMLDDNLNLTLIEVNTNPCLDTPCLILQRIIP